MFTVYLAIWLSVASAEVAPVILAPFKDLDSCLVAAEKLANTEPQLKSKSAREVGAEAVCLTVQAVIV